MKRLLLFLSLLLTPVLGFSQVAGSGHIEIVKAPGDPTTIWFWNVPAPTTFDGIIVESSILLQGPYTDTTVVVQKTDTSVTFPAPSVPTFYRTYFYRVVNGVKIRSVSSNVVAVSLTITAIPVATGS